jgi:DNA-binding MarR family transcriptional regulator
MNNMTKDELEQFIKLNKTINSKIITLGRLDLLILIFYSIEGIQYRELKAALNLSDGKIKSDLDVLLNLGYIEKNEVELDNRSLTIFLITESGKNEIEKIKKWMKMYSEIGGS